MKYLAIATILALALVPAAVAQNHGEVGIFADYLRLTPASGVHTDFAGIGGRLGFNVGSHTQVEAQMAYDFEKVFAATFGTGATATIVRSNLKLLTGSFGPKFNFSSGAVRPFVFLKGSFINFRSSDAVTFGNVGAQIADILDGDTKGGFYPGGGIEFFSGPIGLRLDVGDFMYFADGAHHNLKITLGPQFRF